MILLLDINNSSNPFQPFLCFPPSYSVDLLSWLDNIWRPGGEGLGLGLLLGEGKWPTCFAPTQPHICPCRTCRNNCWPPRNSTELPDGMVPSSAAEVEGWAYTLTSGKPSACFNMTLGALGAGGKVGGKVAPQCPGGGRTTAGKWSIGRPGMAG